MYHRRRCTLCKNPLRYFPIQALPKYLPMGHTWGGVIKIMAKLLIVDDESEALEAFSTALDQAGFAVRTCENGMAAIELFRRERADLVFCDLKLPGIDGLGVLGALKGIDPWATVIMVTAYGSIETATHALRLGAYDFLEKPCTLAQIQQVAKRALEHRRQVRELATLQGKPGQAADLPARLVELEQLKADFLTMVIQDLREPLRLLTKSLDLAREGFYGVWSEVQRPLLHQCARVQAFLSRLLLGSFAIFLSHQQRLEIAPVDLHGLIKQISREMESSTQDKGVALRVALPHEPACGRIDVGKVSSIIRELLANAISATKKNGEIHLELLTQPDCFRIRVSDTGPGISEEEKKWLFTTFHAFPSGHSQHGKKVSLGLPLVRHYLDLLNGRIDLESNSPQGSRFTVTIPWKK